MLSLLIKIDKVFIIPLALSHMMLIGLGVKNFNIILHYTNKGDAQSFSVYREIKSKRKREYSTLAFLIALNALLRLLCLVVLVEVLKAVVKAGLPLPRNSPIFQIPH